MDTPLALEFAMTYRLKVRGPLLSHDGSAPSPLRRYWEMTEATLEGPSLRASTPMTGIDWFTPLADGYGRPHVRLPFLSEEGALILLEYSGIVHASPAFVRAVEHDTATSWSDQYMRLTMNFETTSERYAWLGQSLFIARGRLLGSYRIEYEVYRVM